MDNQKIIKSLLGTNICVISTGKAEKNTLKILNNLKSKKWTLVVCFVKTDISAKQLEAFAIESLDFIIDDLFFYENSKLSMAFCKKRLPNTLKNKIRNITKS